MDPAIAEHIEAGLDVDLTPPEIIGDINVSKSLARYKQEILAGANVQVHLAQARQLRIAQASQRLEKYHMDGIGGLVARIDKKKFDELCLVYGHKWFRDRKTLQHVLDKHPELKVRVNLRTTSIRVNGLRDRSQLRGGAVEGLRGQQGKTSNTERRTPNLESAKTISGLAGCGVQPEIEVKAMTGPLSSGGDPAPPTPPTREAGGSAGHVSPAGLIISNSRCLEFGLRGGWVEWLRGLATTLFLSTSQPLNLSTAAT